MENFLNFAFVTETECVICLNEMSHVKLKLPFTFQVAI